MSFHVGQKVVCVDPTWGSSGALQKKVCPNLPTKDCVYTIRALTMFPLAHPGELFLQLEEIVNAPSTHHSEPWFFASKYRPVHETDISIFTALLTPSQQNQKLKPLVTEDA